MNALKELRVADFDKKQGNAHIPGYVHVTHKIELSGYQLTGAQLFIKNLFNPNTLHKRLLINWQTGVGKSIAAIAIGNEFIKFFQEQYIITKKAQMVCILGFNTNETIKADFFKFPELGYVTEQESKEYTKLFIEHSSKFTNLSSMLSKRITDKSSGGYYQFYGYREFVNSLFLITSKGIQNKITIQEIFATSDNPSLLEEYIENQYVTVNTELINTLKNGLIICDEIHNVYNSLESNNYGSAIKYILDSLGDDAPRAVFMSATPVTGNASEIVDLLNILVPNSKLKRSDLFYRDSDGIYQLKSGSIEQITNMTIDRVSFLLDTDVSLYPKRIFDGVAVENVPYIKFNVFKLSDLHRATVNAETNMVYSQQIRSIYDFVFPNPDSDSDSVIGLYNSADILPKIQKASKEWRDKIGIDTYTDDGVNVITGNFLHVDNIGKYSTKYHGLITDILNTFTKTGKIMIFHYNVQLSGVVLIQEILRVNGFIEESEEVNNTTLCVVCGVKYSSHSKKTGFGSDPDSDSDYHAFKPARFIVAHSSGMVKTNMKRNIAKFNDIGNLHGTEIKIIVGSRIIQEGLNFKAVRVQYVLSLPINFPILIQVLGRVVRKNSHIDLPEPERDVTIKIYAHDIELPRYEHKAKEYKIIQEVEKAIRINAIDNFISYRKNADQYSQNTLESLKFIPQNTYLLPITTKFFDAYGHNDEEIELLSKLVMLLFTNRPVWTFDDLLTEVKNVSNVSYNTDIIDENNLRIALHNNKISSVGKYYILPNVHKNVSIDIESYFRKFVPDPIININLTAHLSKSTESNFYNKIMASYDKKNIELTLLTYPSIFHIELLKRIVLGQVNDEDIIRLYKRFKILIYDSKDPIGYIDNLSVNLYNFNKKEWYNVAHDDYRIGKRNVENDVIIGYVINDSKTTKFKIREPATRSKKDSRTIKKGILCENNMREYVLNLLQKLRKVSNTSSDLKIPHYAADYDKSMTGKQVTFDLCIVVKLYMLSLEEANRNSANGMKDSIRWVYLFHDVVPSAK
jgi:hypothetical protein